MAFAHLQAQVSFFCHSNSMGNMLKIFSIRIVCMQYDLSELICAGKKSKLVCNGQVQTTVQRALGSLPPTAHLLYLEYCFENCDSVM